MGTAAVSVSCTRPAIVIDGGLSDGLGRKLLFPERNATMNALARHTPTVQNASLNPNSHVAKIGNVM
jgi:hypothetical protein